MSEDELSSKIDLRERVPLNTQAIREAIDRIEAQIIESSFEKREADEKILKALERHSELLDSIDHAHYDKKSAETIWLERIFFLILLSVCSHFAFVVFDFP